MKTSSILPSARAWCLRIVLSGILGASSSTVAHDGRGEASAAVAVPVATLSAQAAAAGGRTWPALEKLRAAIDPNEAVDEALGGQTLRGTPVTPRTPDCFPAEPRDLFWQMDKVAHPQTGLLEPLDFDVNRDGKVDDRERNAIRGRNTWLLWGGGNEAFWGWLQEQGYGITDFMILLDSRLRHSRFQRAGLINQPGFKAVTDPAKRLLGLYLDEADGDKAWLLPPAAAPGTRAETADAQGRPVAPVVGVPAAPAGHPTQLFEPGDAKLYEEVLRRLPKDGLDYAIYGYPSGVFGLRLFPNPDFFGNTDAAATARKYWDERVVQSSHASFYTDSKIHADPKLVRPFRVSMSCGFCHVAPHPLLPPKDPENPEWENLSSIIGGQYWKPQPSLANALPRENFLYHFLNSQPPGTIDTSLVSTDHINNTNVINAVFDLPARLERAERKPAERQAGANLLLHGKKATDAPIDIKFPMVLFPGEDSCGVFAALARVPLNIGVFSEQWARSDNPLIGFTKQRPFPVEVCRTNSVFWQVNEKQRVGYMADFFLLGHKGTVLKSTQAMKLRDAGPLPGPDGKPLPHQSEGMKALAADSPELRTRGRGVFLRNCAICHSSKQPDGFDLKFERAIDGDWDRAPAPAEGAPPVYTLPAEYANWEAFRKSPAFAHYRERILELAGPAPVGEAEDAFIQDNYLSNELRIPVTLVGTNSGRAMATNAMRGNVWDNFSSETFKNLPSVGKIRYFNPFSGKAVDDYGANDEYDDGRQTGGPGYLRPPSLISLWATAPYFHNNALGVYTHNPSVASRLEAYDDGIRKLLWNEKRSQYTAYAGGSGGYVPPGDLRAEGSAAAKGDPGYIYRVPVDTFIEMAPGFIRPLLEGIVGRTVFKLLSVWLWVALAAVFLLLGFRGRARHAGVILVLGAVALGFLLAATGLGGFGGTVQGALMLGAGNLLSMASVWWWLLIVALGAAGVGLLLTSRDCTRWLRWSFRGLTVAVLAVGLLANKFLNGELQGLKVGPIPRGTPVDLLMNMDPEKRDKLPQAVVGLIQASVQIKKQNLTGEAAYRVLADKAGPALLAASKCPDYVLDRGHWFGEELTAEEKAALIAFLKTL